MLAINPTYAFYVAYSCHTYTVAVGSLIYPMSGFTTFVKRNKQKKADVFPRLPYKKWQLYATAKRINNLIHYT